MEIFRKQTSRLSGNTWKFGIRTLATVAQIIAAPWDTLLLGLKFCVPGSLFAIKISIYFTSGKQWEDCRHAFVKTNGTQFDARFGSGFVVQLAEYRLEGGVPQQRCSGVVAWQ